MAHDPARAGVDQVASYVQTLAGYRVGVKRMSGSKEVRADAVAGQVNIGRMAIWRAA